MDPYDELLFSLSFRSRGVAGGPVQFDYSFHFSNRVVLLSCQSVMGVCLWSVTGWLCGWRVSLNSRRGVKVSACFISCCIFEWPKWPFTYYAGAKFGVLLDSWSRRPWDILLRWRHDVTWGVLLCRWPYHAAMRGQVGSMSAEVAEGNCCVWHCAVLWDLSMCHARWPSSPVIGPLGVISDASIESSRLRGGDIGRRWVFDIDIDEPKWRYFWNMDILTSLRDITLGELWNERLDII